MKKKIFIFKHLVNYDIPLIPLQALAIYRTPITTPSRTLHYPGPQASAISRTRPRTNNICLGQKIGLRPKLIAEAKLAQATVIGLKTKRLTSSLPRGPSLINLTEAKYGYCRPNLAGATPVGLEAVRMA